MPFELCSLYALFTLVTWILLRILKLEYNWLKLTKLVIHSFVFILDVRFKEKTRSASCPLLKISATVNCTNRHIHLFGSTYYIFVTGIVQIFLIRLDLFYVETYHPFNYYANISLFENVRISFTTVKNFVTSCAYVVGCTPPLLLYDPLSKFYSRSPIRH